MFTLTDFIKRKPYLIWYVSDHKSISEEAIVESVLNYGDFIDFKKLISILGIKKISRIFTKQLKQKRVNYDRKIINYFKLYFAKYA